jgi:hypothetical protein
LHGGAIGSFGCSSGSKIGLVEESRRVIRAFLFSRRIIFFFFLLSRFAVERERERERERRGRFVCSKSSFKNT